MNVDTSNIHNDTTNVFLHEDFYYTNTFYFCSSKDYINPMITININCVKLKEKRDRYNLNKKLQSR